ncbi:hypothetical protein [Agromyces albus]|uniref:LPXTG cell wall anchor domain-containing protein n=1 Tax=Agromyces albus TaxID=205332 RepID=A0A4Q2L292_9MICO|nr:hypothetical protein [Agromyces albus]RXZ72218.1 hypothetical protein ESP51_04865 [Agromyces albus]
MTRKLVAAALLALAAVFAIPTVANAGEAGYTGDGPGVVTVDVGETVSLTFSDLPPNTPSTATADDAVTLSVLKASTASKPTSASGAVTYTAMSTQAGTYTITVTAGQAVATATLTVVPADSSSTGGLPSTGYDFPIALLWGGVGAVILGGALVAVLTTVRRNRASA